MAKKLLCILLTLIMLLSAMPVTELLAAETEAPSAESVTLDDVVAAASTVIRQNEGNYSSVSPDDNGALSIGWIQWHANRALNLLKTIVAADTAKAKELLGDELYNEITTVSSWSTRILTTDEAAKISALISTDAGKKAQDDLAAQDISSYINHAIGYGITDPAALVYFADIENQCGSGGSKRVAAAAAVLAGSYGAITLEHIHEAALADSIAGGKHSTRRQRTYNNCLLLDWEIVNTEYEVWDILSTRNVRQTPDTTSPLVTSIPKGTKVIISEKAAFGTQTRGKTSMGWITIDDGSCALNEELTGKYVPAPVIFNTNGGSFGSSHKALLKADGLNTSRPNNSIIIYNGDYPHANAQTNAYGSEVAVDASGTVLSSPVYGTGKTAIPEGGFVISGIGSGYTLMAQSIKAGNYAVFDKDRMAVYIYDSYEAYINISKASTKATAKNTLRPANSLIIYDNDYNYSNAQTNAYGTEIAVDASGKVLNAPVYGIGKTAIPEGGYVISGIGSGYTWLSQNVKAGEYVIIDKNTLEITVYADVNKLLGATKTTEYKKEFGPLPVPEKAGYEFCGWITEGSTTAVSGTDICSSLFCMVLTATWKEGGDTISFDTNGGSIAGVSKIEINGVNITRPIDSVIIYDKDCNSSVTPTNQYGAEAAVDADGIVISTPVYGTCKTNIPEGGYVISAIGTGCTWLIENVKKGSFVSFDRERGILTVYENRSLYDSLNRKVVAGYAIGVLPEAEREYHKFLGWYSINGERITADTLMTSGGITLIAKWELLPGKLSFNADGGKTDALISSAKLHGTNVQRPADSIVLYKDKASTGTNKYGSEALIGKDGTVLAVYPYGYGNCPIPKDCSVLSGIGTGNSWISANLFVGCYVVIKNGIVSVYKDKNAFDASSSAAVKYGGTYPALPTAAKVGYAFLGWADPSGNIVKSGSTVAHYGDITLTAKWEKLTAVTFNANGGKLDATVAATTAAGINIQRASNSLVIYAGKASTGTNVYGREAVIDKSGKVLAVNPYGRGNTVIPEGCIVLSGIGTMDTWISNNLKVGYYVQIKGFKVTVYESAAALDAADGVIYVRSGSAIGYIPHASYGENALKGWYLNDTPVSAATAVSSDTHLFAKWTKTSAKLIFDLNGGTIKGARATTKADAVNTLRSADTLVIYDENYAYSCPQTNAYGAEAAVGADGIVISRPVYGTCKTPIPEGGFVLSAIGTKYNWLYANLKVGDYVHFDKNTMTVTVYDSYESYLFETGITVRCNEPYGLLPIPEKEGCRFAGWKDSEGNLITSSTVVKSCDVPVLTAVWKDAVSVTFDPQGGTYIKDTATLAGTNIIRALNCLVLYKDKASTGTNVYGTEVIVDASGKITTVYPYGKGNAPIPAGCYALSGNGTMSQWMQSLKVGNFIVIDGSTVKVYENEASRLCESGPVFVLEGTAMQTLPVPKKYGYTFDGWYLNGNKLTTSTVITSSCTYTAKWTAKKITVTFDTNGGSFTPPATRTADGKNVQRVLDAVVIYDRSDERTSTGTNQYGTEALVGPDGIVIDVRYNGQKDAPIPEGGFVISGNGEGSVWVKTNFAVGSYVVLDGMDVTVYKSPAHIFAQSGKTVTFGTAYGPLPIPSREGFTFEGWYTKDGTPVDDSSILLSENSPLVLFAKWK